MTEDEAKTKWCPFARYVTLGVVAGNRFGNNDTRIIECRCIASACMMWVTTEGHNKQGTCGLIKGG